MTQKSAQTDPVVRFEKVQKAYDADRLVVRDLNMDIFRGEFLTMLGPSGSGKTTTLMMLAGFETPTSGEIYLNGRSTSRIPPHLRNIGMVFQNYALFPHMSIEENLAFPLDVRKIPKTERESRVRAALDMVELSSFGSRRPAQLSGGQQQRVALARALIFEPEIVLMDEPLGALDKRLREQLQYEIKALHRRLGLTIVYVTHDQSEALTMSDRVAIFNQGIIEQLSSPKELYENPQTSFVANFVGENNEMGGVVHSIGANGACTIRFEGGQFVHAFVRSELALGQTVALTIRPERVRLGKPKAGENLSGVEGRVEDVIYYGDYTRICISIPGQRALLALKQPNDGYTPREIGVGSTLTVHWGPGDCQVRAVVSVSSESADIGD